MKNWTIWVPILALGLLLVVPAGADSVKGKAGSDKLYEYTAATGAQSRATLMWAKAGSDLDMGIFRAADGLPVGIGEGVNERLESVEIGAINNTTYLVLVTKFSGPNTNFWLNVSATGGQGLRSASSRGSRARNLRFVGDLAELALLDPFYERLERKVARLREIKRALR